MAVKVIPEDTIEERLTKRLEEITAERDRLKSDLAKLEKYKKYVDMADEFGAMRDAMTGAGFTDDQAFQFILACVNKAL